MPEASNVRGNARSEPGTPVQNAAVGIGARVADRRRARQLSVSELARRVDVSPSLISQIERDQSRPSVSTLFALSQALGVSVDSFFRDDPPHPETLDADGSEVRRDRYFVPRQSRDTLDIEGGVRWERLTPAPVQELDFMELVYEPHAESNAQLYRHPGSEIVLMLAGCLDIFVGFEHYHLEPGDSIHFPSSLPHRYVNPSDETARAVTVILRDGHNPPPANWEGDQA
jgi:transcriptional regulator with XRE-family HTH domain